MIENKSHDTTELNENGKYHDNKVLQDETLDEELRGQLRSKNEEIKKNLNNDSAGNQQDT